MKRDQFPIVPRRDFIAGAAALSIGYVENDRTADSNAVEEDDNESEESTPENDNPVTGEVAQIGELRLTSPVFDHGERIPEMYGYEAENVNPPLEIEAVPEDADSLALVVDDPDAVEPAGKVWTHWIVWNIPTETTTIPEDWDPTDAEEGTNDFGEIDYGGPNPPDTEHRYRFKLFTIDTMFELPPETDAEALGTTMEGNILEQTQLDGTYPA